MRSDSSVDPDPDAIRASVGEARTVLLLGESDDPLAEEVCTVLLSANEPQETNLLSVAIGQSPDRRLAAWRTHVGELPARTGVLAVGETTRGAAATDGGGVTPGNGPVSIDTLEDPGDLTGLAFAISAYLDAWDDTSASPVVCLHSLSVMLEHVELPQLFRFLHVTSGLFRRHDAKVVCHLDPTAHDISTVGTLQVLFEAVVRIEDDGSVSVDNE